MLRKPGFDALRGKFIKSYNGNVLFSFALKIFKIPINYHQVVMKHPLLLYSVPYVMRNRMMQQERLEDNFDEWRQGFQGNFPNEDNRR